jgi:hypothetical protein
MLNLRKEPKLRAWQECETDAKEMKRNEKALERLCYHNVRQYLKQPFVQTQGT